MNKKAKINYLVDLLALLSFLGTALSSLIIYFFLPSGIRQGGQALFWGISKRDWAEFHEITGLIFIALALIHLFLHLKWIGATTRCLFRKKDPNLK